LCQSHEGYFQLWQAGVGPGQPRPPGAQKEPREPPHGPGTELTRLFRPIRLFVRKGRQERLECYHTICHACPEDAFDGPADEGGYCTKHCSNKCDFGRLLANPKFWCEFWK